MEVFTEKEIGILRLTRQEFADSDVPTPMYPQRCRAILNALELQNVIVRAPVVFRLFASIHTSVNSNNDAGVALCTAVLPFDSAEEADTAAHYLKDAYYKNGTQSIVITKLYTS